MTDVGPSGIDTADDDASGGLVLRNVAELQKRSKARELGTTLALQIFRLLRVSQFHALDNMAVLAQLEQCVEAIRAFGAQTSEPLSLLFARGTVFVAGQLLKASRNEYEAALELGAMVERLGLSEIVIQPDVEREDLTELARLFQPGAHVEIEGNVLEPTPKIRLRKVSAALFDEEDEELPPDEQVLRTYASSVVVMRRVFDNLNAGRYQLPHQAKRLAQRLVMLSEGDTPAFLGVTAMRNLNHDAAGRAVNRAILAVTIARQLTDDLGTLARIAMSALFLDVAHPLLTGVAGMGDATVVPRLTEDEELRLPAATTLVLTALGQLRSASMLRSVVAYEAHWLRRESELGPLYGGERKASIASRVVATASRFNELLSPDLAANRSLTPDEAISVMRAEAKGSLERAMVHLLVGALGIFPSGTAVELSTGERGVVVRTPDNPVDYVRPTVRLIYDAQGKPLARAALVDLTLDPVRQVVSVVRSPDPLLRAASEAALTEAVSQMATPATLSTTPPPSPSRQAATQPPPVSRRPTPPPTRRPEAMFSTAAPPRRISAVDIPSVDTPTVMREYQSLPPEAIPDEVEISEIEPSSPSAPSSHWRKQPSARQREALSMTGAFTPANLSPSAQGSLTRTPFSHLLLYVFDRGLSGTMIFREPAADGDRPVEHAIYVESGAPTKAVLQRRRASLGSLLVADGALEQEQLQSDPITQPPDDDALLESELLDLGLVDESAIATARCVQLRERLEELFGLPTKSEYAFFAGLDLLEERWGRIGGAVETLPLIAGGLREHPERASMDRMLGRLGEHSLRLHPSADLDAFEFADDERVIADVIGRESPTLEDVLAVFSDHEVVKRVVYCLLLTRNVIVSAQQEA